MSNLKINLDMEEIDYLYSVKLWSVSNISKKFKVNHGTITLRLKKFGTKLRSHSENQLIIMNKPNVKKKVSEGSKRSSKQRMQTNIKKYGTSVPSNNISIKKKWKKKHLEKYETEWPNQRNDVREQYKITCKKRYNTDNVSKIQKVKNKISKNRWKNKSQEELIEIENKTKKTWFDNFGEVNPLNNKFIKEQVKQKRWINKTKIELKEIQEKCDKTRIKNSLLKIEKRLNLLDLELIDNFKNITEKTRLKCLKCNTIFESILDYIFHSYGLCPKCFPCNNGSSLGEKEVFDFISNLIGKTLVLNKCRNIIKNPKTNRFLELDIYVPTKKIAFEYNGIYYHSDLRSNNPIYFHLQKTKLCEEKDIQLIHIFEDEWMFKKNIVKSRIKQILGISNNERIHARKCEIKEIEPKVKNEFLEEFHIQGKDNSNIKLGAFNDNKLISVMTFSKGNISKGSKSKEGVWELNRFCSNSNYHIPGIAGKLLSY